MVLAVSGVRVTSTPNGASASPIVGPSAAEGAPVEGAPVDLAHHLLERALESDEATTDDDLELLS